MAIPRRKRIKRTSREAFDKIKADGSLSAMRMQAYSVVRFYGPVTSLEVDTIGTVPGNKRPSLHKRLSELERLGLIKVVGQRKCRVSGNQAEEWDITDHVPDSFVLPKKATRAELVELLSRSAHLLGEGSPPSMVSELRKEIRDVLREE
jgi:hypothetical protein